MPLAFSPEPAFRELSFGEKVRSTGHRNLAVIPPISTIAGIPWVSDARRIQIEAREGRVRTRRADAGPSDNRAHVEG
jgi:hypothetical protein